MSRNESGPLSPKTPARCAALPYRVRDGAVEVLLITRRGRSGWIIPKGKVDRDLGPGESARREAAEEAGVEGEVASAAFDEYRHGGGDDDPLVHVFLLRVTQELSTWPEADERERRWVRVQQASTLVADPGLTRVLSAAAAYLTTEHARAPVAEHPISPYSATVPPKRGAFTPLRLGLGLLLLGVLAVAAFALVSGRRDGAEARNAIQAEAGAEKDGRDGISAATPAAAAFAPGDPACRVDGASVALPDRLSETSGIAAGLRAPGVLWSHNDSGQPLLYAFAPDGSALGVVRVAGARMENWEDVSAGPCAGGSCLYVADIGDNAASRANITVYRVPEPAPTDAETRPAEAFHATYPEGPQDAEALFVLPDGGVYVVTKGETGPIALYRFPQPLRAGATARLERIVELGAATKRKDRITGASASPDGRWVALRTLEAVDIYRAADLVRGVPGTPVRVDLRSLGEPQGEGVGWGPPGTVYLTSESGKKNKPGTLSRLSCTPGA